MKCSHCLTDFHEKTRYVNLSTDKDGNWWIAINNCPNPSCQKAIYRLFNAPGYYNNSGLTPNLAEISNDYLVRPKAVNRHPVPIEVTKNVAEDYTEACLI